MAGLGGAGGRVGQIDVPEGAGLARAGHQRLEHPGGPEGRRDPSRSLAPARCSGTRRSRARRGSRPRGRPRPCPRCERPFPGFRPRLIPEITQLRSVASEWMARRTQSAGVPATASDVGTPGRDPDGPMGRDLVAAARDRPAGGDHAALAQGRWPPAERVHPGASTPSSLVRTRIGWPWLVIVPRWAVSCMRASAGTAACSCRDGF